MTKILVTRPEPDAHSTAARLAGLGFEPVIAPMLQFELRTANLPSSEGLGGIIATSTNAIRALQECNALAPLLPLKLFAVGERTAAAATDAGFENVVTTGHNAAELVEHLKNESGTAPLFYPHAGHVSLDLAAALAPTGRLVLSAVVYDMVPALSLDDDIITGLGTRIPAVSLYSRRTAEIFCALVGGRLTLDQKRAVTLFALSQNVATPLLAERFARVCLADHPSEEAMQALALSFLRAQNRS